MLIFLSKMKNGGIFAAVEIEQATRFTLLSAEEKLDRNGRRKFCFT